MARYFFDTSALVKRYHAESGTPEVRRLLTEPGAECVISRLATVEMLSGFAGKVRTGVFSTAAFTRFRSQFLADVKRRVVRPIRIVNAHYSLTRVRQALTCLPPRLIPLANSDIPFSPIIPCSKV
jgi:hypothetical protein